MSKAAEKVTDEKLDSVRETCEEGEARWLCSRLALAAARFPKFVAAVFAKAFKYEFGNLIDTVIGLRDEMKTVRQENAQLRADVDQLKARLDKAGQLVKAIDERTRPRAAQPRR